MNLRFKFSILGVTCLLLSTFEVCIVGAIFFNPCDDILLRCHCGSSSGYPVHMTMKQCFSFYSWPPQCKPCASTQYSLDLIKLQALDSTTAGILCAPFGLCQECHDDAMHCVSCPSGKYGKWCLDECQCQNEGVCNQKDGTCRCPPGYVGEFCQTRQATQCIPLETVAKLHWDNGQSSNIGSVVTAWCSPGYALMGNKTRSCTSEGTWTGAPPMCDPVCQFPSLGAHLQTSINPGMLFRLLDADNKEVVKEISFSCDAGYSLVGPHRIQCQMSGSWDQEPPRCKPKIICGDPGMPSNCTRLILDAVDGAFAPGTQIKFSCTQDFFLDGAEVLICIATGSWSAALPRCLPVSGCPIPAVPRNGKLEMTNPVSSIIMPITNTIVTRMRIPKGLKLLSRRAIPSPDHGSPNSRALYTCQPVYYRLKGPNARICLPNGQWGGKEPVCEAICGQTPEPKRPSIINGTTSEFGRWPWQAIIGFRDSTTDKWRKTCGGSLVSESFVVTAAHCVAQKMSSQIHPVQNFRVYLGKHFRFDNLDDAEVRLIMVESIVIHPNYHPRSLDSDIAMIKLKIPLQFSRRIQPVCLPRPSVDWHEEMPEGQIGVVTGWGKTEDGLPSDVLQEAAIPIVRRQKCEEGYRSVNVSVTVTTNMFCAGLEQGGIGTCKGDSGGPFVMKKETGGISGYVLEGLISWGSTKACVMASQYSGFLKVANFAGWINQFL